jgi:hypothetical protein
MKEVLLSRARAPVHLTMPASPIAPIAARCSGVPTHLAVVHIFCFALPTRAHIHQAHTPCIHFTMCVHARALALRYAIVILAASHGVDASGNVTLHTRVLMVWLIGCTASCRNVHAQITQIYMHTCTHYTNTLTRAHTSTNTYTRTHIYLHITMHQCGVAARRTATARTRRWSDPAHHTAWCRTRTHQWQSARACSAGAQRSVAIRI